MRLIMFNTILFSPVSIWHVSIFATSEVDWPKGDTMAAGRFHLGARSSSIRLLNSALIFALSTRVLLCSNHSTVFFCIVLFPTTRHAQQLPRRSKYRSIDLEIVRRASSWEVGTSPSMIGMQAKKRFLGIKWPATGFWSTVTNSNVSLCCTKPFVVRSSWREYAQPGFRLFTPSVFVGWEFSIGS